MYSINEISNSFFKCRGLLVFSGVLLFVWSTDFLLAFILSARPGLAKGFASLKHFSWYFSQLARLDSIQIFLSGIAANKPGLLGSEWFYAAMLLTYLIATLCFVWFFFGSKIEISKHSEYLIFRSEKIFLLCLLSWVLLKQILFVFLIPPWQGPDEPYHYLYVGSYKEDVSVLKEKIFESTEKYNFQKLYDQLDYPYFPLVYRWNKEEIRKHQPPLYYKTVAFLVEKTGHDLLPQALYVGRMVSAVCMTLTIFIVYRIALFIFSAPDQKYLAQLAAVVAAAFPQSSFLGSTMGSDSMMIMFANCAILLMFMGMVHTKGNLSKFFIFLSSIFFSFLAFGTKSSGFIVIPFILAGISIYYYLKFFKSIKFGWAYFLLIIFSFSLFFLSLFISYDFLNLKSVFLNKIFPLDRLFYREIRGQWWFLNLRYHLITFVSFWITYGWMVYKVSIGTYVFLAILSFAILLGVVKNFIKGGIETRSYLLYFLFFFAVIVSIVLTYKDSQGRFLYVGISSWAILFIVGLLSWAPKEKELSCCKIIGGIFFLFNIAAVFGLLIPAFYLNRF